MTSPFALAAMALATLGAALGCAVPAAAQETGVDAQPLDPAITMPQSEDEPTLVPTLPDANDRIEFEADELAFDEPTNTVFARGTVILRSEDASVRADEVVWNRDTGEIIARGSIRFVDNSGNQIFTETLTLNDQFEAGAMDELLLALRAGGRLAARSAERGEDGTVALTDAAYSACAVTGEDGCEKDPSWRITADRVVYDPDESRVEFDGAVLELFGARILPLPGLAIRTDGRAESGFLVPDIRFDQVNGLEISSEYYLRVADNQDLTLGAFVYSDVAPMVSAQWRHLTEKGAYQITGYATSSGRVSNFGAIPTTESDPRGYLFANGKFLFSPEWSLTGS
ncbi:LPS-assembly protein LptD, partial [Sulfitobacter sp.]|uniref:LPS-assembly protein LptD n=1 Tax=Sulfitobacter sp. TaxID=1903071 RepID=UPI003EF95C86